MEADRVRLRSEAEAPWRSLRLVLCGFSVASAGMGTLISLPQLIGAVGNAPGALAVNTVLENLAVNLGAVGLFGFLFRRDWQAREKQMARLAREEQLANQQVQLANGKRLRLVDLQGTSRVVLAAGTTQQVAEALAAAEPYREQLMRRGVLVVPLPIFSSSNSSSSSNGASSNGSSSAAATIPALKPEDLRWRVQAINPEAWRSWFDEQLALTTKATADQGLYIGLRLDGRTRASGMGCPPWARFAAELAPLEGDDKWVGFFDGFDGRV